MLRLSLSVILFLFSSVLSSPTAAQSLTRLEEPPEAYRQPNFVPREAPREPDAALVSIVPTAPRTVDTGARVRDEILGGLLGYGLGVATGLLTLLSEPEDWMLGIMFAQLAPLGLALGTFFGGLAHGQGRIDGALIGILVAALIALPVLSALQPERPMEDPLVLAIGLAAPVVGAVTGAEIALAIGERGARF